ncbi:MAG: hypothetical protein Q4C56_09475 [Peptococcaceae bacterium]|nr:hypothetical protein [Peptococcaceae bacterium]
MTAKPWKILYVIVNIVVLFGILILGLKFEHLQPLLTNIMQGYLILQLCVILIVFLTRKQKMSLLVKALTALWVCLGIVLAVLLLLGVSGLFKWQLLFYVLCIVISVVQLMGKIE